MDLSSDLLVCMASNNSIVYIGFNLQVKRAYYGMVHKRSPHERWQEHWKAVMQHSAGITSEVEMKYTFMARHGGAASWLFLLYISCGQVIPQHRLQDLEGKIIGLYPNSLNRMRHSGSLYKAVPVGGQAPEGVSEANDVKVPQRIVAIESRQGISQISRKNNFSIWGQICSTLGCFQRTCYIRI